MSYYRDTKVVMSSIVADICCRAIIFVCSYEKNVKKNLQFKHRIKDDKLHV